MSNNEIIIKSYPSKRLAFNFSFITTSKKYNLDHVERPIKLKLLEKLEQLSRQDMVVLFANLRRSEGFEKLPSEAISGISLPADFKNSSRLTDCEPGFWVFRLNDKARVIGKKNQNIFYIIAIDTKFKAYKH